jgi:hypothetical protein
MVHTLFGGGGLVAVTLALLAACAPRWVPYAPAQIPTGDPPNLVYRAMVTRARAMGYDVVENDPEGGFFKVRAHLDADVAIGQWGRAVLRFSYFGVQVHGDGAASVTATGYHVRGREVHVKLQIELQRFVSGLRQERPA